MANGNSSSKRTVFLGSVAVVGWAFAIYFGVNASQSEERLNSDIADLNQQLSTLQDASGTLDTLRTKISTLEPELNNTEKFHIFIIQMMKKINCDSFDTIRNIY